MPIPEFPTAVREVKACEVYVRNSGWLCSVIDGGCSWPGTLVSMLSASQLAPCYLGFVMTEARETNKLLRKLNPSDEASQVCCEA